MFCTKLRLFKCRLKIQYMIQSSFSSSPTDFPEFVLDPKFSTAEQQKILSTLNESNSKHLSSLNIAQSRIKNLENYKKRKGPFRSLDELLEVDGLSMKVLEKICKQIITNTPSQNVKSANNENKRIKQLLVPPLTIETTNVLTSAIGIHLAPMGVSWAKIIKRNNKLECWGYHDFANLPKKLCPTDTFQLATDILDQLPTGDAYIFESANGMGLQGQKPSSTVTSYTLQLELSSMLLALINTSRHHNKTYQDDFMKTELMNCVYFIRSKLPARLFRTLIGNECVSNNATVVSLLDNSPKHDYTLPCAPINVEEVLKNDYLTHSAAHKELLGQALMLTVAFMELCVNKNPVTIKAIIPGKK